MSDDDDSRGPCGGCETCHVDICTCLDLEHLKGWSPITRAESVGEFSYCARCAHGARRLAALDKCRRCPNCKIPPSAENEFGYEWMLICHNCYDADCVGDPPRYVSRSLTAHGRTFDEAIAEWDELVEDAEMDETVETRQPTDAELLEEHRANNKENAA